MKLRVILTTVVSALLLLAAIAAGLNAVFTVTSVRVSFSTLSSVGRSDAAALQEELNAFAGKSSVFLDLDEVRATVEKYPAFRLTSIKKDLPQTLELSVVERSETYAFRRENGSYAVLDSDGIYLYEKDSAENRVAGDNITITFLAWEYGEEGATANPYYPLSAGGDARAEGEYFEQMMTVFTEFTAVLPDIRMNVCSIEYGKYASDVDYFYITMREGVTLWIDTPGNYTAEKARAAIQKYCSLTDRERTYGEISASDLGAAESVTAVWNPESLHSESA